MKRNSRVSDHERRKPNGGTTHVKGYIRRISVPSHYKRIKPLDRERYKYCEDGQYFTQGRLLADDVTAPKGTSTDDVEEVFEEKAGDEYEYLHAESMKNDARWNRMTIEKRREYLASRGFPEHLAKESWSGVTAKIKKAGMTRQKWEAMSVRKRKKWLSNRDLPETHAKRTWDGLPEDVKVIKNFKVWGIPEKKVPKPTGACAKRKS